MAKKKRDNVDSEMSALDADAAAELEPTAEPSAEQPEPIAADEPVEAEPVEELAEEPAEAPAAPEAPVAPPAPVKKAAAPAVKKSAMSAKPATGVSLTARAAFINGRYMPRVK